MKFSNQLIIGLSILMISVSCKTVVTITDSSAGISVPSNNGQRHLEDISLNGKVYSALWQQNAAEFRALCYQAYNIATEIVKEKSSMQHLRPIAIVTDIDETFLDNSPYAVTQALKGKEFDQQSWLDWTSKGEAVAFPGSVEFFNYAASRNVVVFYISNRNENDRPGTIKNLKALGFPFADDDHVLLMKDTSNKEERRKQVLEQYEIFLLLGDNLSDFSEIFYHKSQAERNRLTDEHAVEFGKRFIVLPNSGYGEWESFMPGYNSKLSPAQKDSVILKNVKGY
ncbi:MAG: 5'-nucleotidase, lipoprotein e(P4) family [Flavobacteriia bacterium]|nr:5'-nucleotidase, lipoprotein e(P4) family [Flavobacteriia bacterium]